MAGELQKKLAEAENNPLYVSLKEYLISRRAMPKIELAHYIGEGTSGEFSSGPVLSDPGTVSVLYNSSISTLIHELTHAASRQMTAQYYETLKNPAEQDTQFMQNYNKLRFNPGLFQTPEEKYPQQASTKAIPGGQDWLNSRGDYRASDSESPAWGQAMASDAGRRYDPAPSHIDPTQATEFQVLLAAAVKAMQSKQGPQGR